MSCHFSLPEFRRGDTKFPYQEVSYPSTGNWKTRFSAFSRKIIYLRILYEPSYQSRVRTEKNAIFRQERSQKPALLSQEISDRYVILRGGNKEWNSQNLGPGNPTQKKVKETSQDDEEGKACDNSRVTSLKSNMARLERREEGQGSNRQEKGKES